MPRKVWYEYCLNNPTYLVKSCHTIESPNCEDYNENDHVEDKQHHTKTSKVNNPTVNNANLQSTVKYFGGLMIYIYVSSSNYEKGST